MLKQIIEELRKHALFTIFGAVTGIVIVINFQGLPFEISYNIFYVLHPLHVLLSTLITASMYELHKCGRLKGKCSFAVLLIIGYAGLVGIATFFIRESEKRKESISQMFN